MIKSKSQHAGDHAPGHDDRAWRLEAMSSDGYCGCDHDHDCEDDHDD